MRLGKSYQKHIYLLISHGSVFTKSYLFSLSWKTTWLRMTTQFNDQFVQILLYLNSLRPNDVILLRRPWSTLVQVTACCLRHQVIAWINVNLSSINFEAFTWDQFHMQFLWNQSVRWVWKLLKLLLHLPGANELMATMLYAISCYTGPCYNNT